MGGCVVTFTCQKLKRLLSEDKCFSIFVFLFFSFIAMLLTYNILYV